MEIWAGWGYSTKCVVVGCNFNKVHMPCEEVGSCSVGKVCVGLLGEGICITRTEADLAGGGRAWCKQVWYECQCCAGFHRWLCVYDEGWEREIVPTIVPGEVHSEL